MATFLDEDEDELKKKYYDFMDTEDWKKYFQDWVINLYWCLCADEPDKLIGIRT